MSAPVIGVEGISSAERDLLPYLMRHTAQQLKLPEPIDGLLRRGADEIDRLRDALNEILEHDPNPQAKHVARRGLGLLPDDLESTGKQA